MHLFMKYKDNNKNSNLNCNIFKMNSIKIIKVNLIIMRMVITIKWIMIVNSVKKIIKKKNQKNNQNNMKIIKESMKKEMNN